MTQRDIHRFVAFHRRRHGVHNVGPSTPAGCTQVLANGFKAGFAHKPTEPMRETRAELLNRLVSARFGRLGDH